MNIPNKFTIFSQNITVEIVESLDNNEYGMYNDAIELISLAKTVKVDCKIIKLSQLQIEATFWHEVFHVMQRKIKGDCNEAEAESYANALLEVIRTGGLRISPNEIIRDKRTVYDNQENYS